MFLSLLKKHLKIKSYADCLISEVRYFVKTALGEGGRILLQMVTIIYISYWNYSEWIERLGGRINFKTNVFQLMDVVYLSIQKYFNGFNKILQLSP